MVSAESGRLLANPDQLAVGLSSVRAEGNGVYTITTGRNERFRLVKRVGGLDPGVDLEYSIAAPLRAGDVPTVDLTLSDRLGNDDIAPALANALAESTAVLRTTGSPPHHDDDRVFSPRGTPDTDAVQRPIDAGHRAELRQRGLLERRLTGVRRAMARAEIRKLALTMGVADEQPNAELRRSLLTEDERAILDRAKDRSRRPLEDRASLSTYLGRAVGASGVTSVALGTAAAAATGDPLVGLGIAVPTIASAAAGALTERRLDRQRAESRQPLYSAIRTQHDHDYPGPQVLLDGEKPARPPDVKVPKAPAWRNYLFRHSMPTLAAAAVAGALTPLGVPAWSTAMVVASSSLARTLADRLVDIKKMKFRIQRVDATERHRRADPALYVNQLTAEFADLQTRLDRVAGALGKGPADPPDADRELVRPPGVPSPEEVPLTPPFSVVLSVQGIDNVTSTARRLFVGTTPTTVDVDPTALARHVSAQTENLIGATGPGLLGAITGAMGDKYFLTRDENARFAAKQWSLRHQQAAQAEALAETFEPRLRLFRELTDRLEELAGAPAGPANPDLPVVTSRPDTPRPAAQAPASAYAVQVAAGTLGGVAGAVGLDVVLDLPDLAVVLTVAGAAGSTAATPVARRLFRNREAEGHEALEDYRADQAVDQSALLKERAISRYLMTQLSMRADAVLRRTQPARVELSPAAASPYYTDRVRAAVRRAELDNVPPGQEESAFDRDARADRVQALERIEHWAGEVDRAQASKFPADTVAHARQNTRFAIELYESIADSNGDRLRFPDLRTVDPADGRPVVGGLTDQIRAAADRAVRRLAAEPAGKPLLPERLIALEQLSRAADAVDHHAVHGTDESRAQVQQHFNESRAEVDRLWHETGTPEGLRLPTLGTPAEQLSNPNQPDAPDLAHLRRMIDHPRTTTRPPQSAPLTRHPRPDPHTPHQNHGNRTR